MNRNTINTEVIPNTFVYYYVGATLLFIICFIFLKSKKPKQIHYRKSYV